MFAKQTLAVALGVATVLVFSDPQSGAAQEIRETGETAAQANVESLYTRIIQAGSYSFDASIRTQTTSDRAPRAHQIAAKLVTGKPAFFSLKGQEAYRNGANLVFRNKRTGKWEKFDRNRMQPSPASGTREEKSEGEKETAVDDDQLVLLSELILPHYILKELRGNVPEMKVTAEGERVALSGTLDEKSVRRFVPASLLGGMKTEKEQISGAIRIIASKDGEIEAVMVWANTPNRSYTLEYTIKDINKTELEVPEEVRPLVLGSKD